MPNFRLKNVFPTKMGRFNWGFNLFRNIILDHLIQGQIQAFWIKSHRQYLKFCRNYRSRLIVTFNLPLKILILNYSRFDIGRDPKFAGGWKLRSALTCSFYKIGLTIYEIWSGRLDRNSRNQYITNYLLVCYLSVWQTLSLPKLKTFNDFE